jgi:flavin reductase (DIM6/NTAB) family NADH-FMN oxidoreductase RutF
MSIDGSEFREVLSHFATGITIVTSSTESGPVGFTCQAFSALSLDPPLIIIAASNNSSTWPKIAAAGSFCVNILGSSQEALCRSFAVSGSDKFAGVGWKPTASGDPRLEGSLAWVDCSLESITGAGDHELVVGGVRDLGTSEGTPLLYYRSGFGGFAS